MTIHVQFDQLIIDFLFTIIYVFYLQTFDDEMELDRGREKSRNLFEKRWIWTQASTSLNFYYPSFLLDPFIPYSRSIDICTLFYFLSIIHRIFFLLSKHLWTLLKIKLIHDRWDEKKKEKILKNIDILCSSQRRSFDWT